VIEQAEGRPLDQLMQDRYSRRSLMTRTGLIIESSSPPTIADRLRRHRNFLSQTKRFPALAAGRDHQRRRCGPLRVRGVTETS